MGLNGRLFKIDGQYPPKQDYPPPGFTFIAISIPELHFEPAQPRKDRLYPSPYPRHCLLTRQFASCVRARHFTLRSFRSVLKEDFVQPTARQFQ